LRTKISSVPLQHTGPRIEQLREAPHRGIRM
jgi:hypothetical protein